MVRKRINTDIRITSKLSALLDEAQDIKLEIRLPKQQRRYIPDFYEILGDMLYVEFKASQQNFPGVYDLYLSYKIDDGKNSEGLSTYTADYCGAFELVESSCMLQDADTDVYFEWVLSYYNYDLLTEEQKEDIAERTAKYIESAPGPSEAQHTVKLHAAEVEWDLDWVKIYPPADISLQNKRVVSRSLQVFTSYGICGCSSIVNYPEEIYSANGKYFRLKDRSNLLNQETAFEYVIFEYDLVDDLEDRRNYDFIKKYNFGNNVILEEDRLVSGGYEHGMQGRATFETIYPDFKGVHYMTLDPGFSPQGSIPDRDEAEVLSQYNADIIIRPYYVETPPPLPIIESRYLNPDILKVICHGDNSHKRIDVTPDEKTFLLNTVCAGSIVNESNLDSGSNGSYGFGLEFYENTRAIIWDDRYPDILHRSQLDLDRDIVIDGDRQTIHIYASRKLSLIKGLSPGDPIEVVDRAGTVFSNTIESVIDWESGSPVRGSIVLSTPMEGYVYSSGTVYIWCPIGTVWNKYAEQSEGASQSFAANIIGTKLRMIKDKTKVSWGVCRHAARMTASLSTYNEATGEYTTNWNMYQGFGVIDVDKAVAYIKSNQDREAFKSSNMVNLPKTSNLLGFEDYKGNNYAAIKYVENLFNYVNRGIQTNVNLLTSYEFGPEYFTLTSRMYDRCWPIYESKGSGSWTPGIIKLEYPVQEGQKFTLTAFMRVVTELEELVQYPYFRVIQKATDGSPDIDFKAYMTEVNTWEFINLQFEVTKTGVLQMQVIQSVPTGSLFEIACLSMCDDFIDSPVYLPELKDVMNYKE